MDYVTVLSVDVHRGQQLIVCIFWLFTLMLSLSPTLRQFFPKRLTTAQAPNAAQETPREDKLTGFVFMCIFSCRTVFLLGLNNM